jgi:predicted nucleic acid-binding protein
VIVLDTSVIHALLDRADRRHAESVAWYETADEDLATTPLVIAEADHLAATRAGPVATRAFRHDVAVGAYSVEWWGAAPAQAVEIAERYEDLGLGLTDASLVALAAQLETTRLATFDERHFRAVRPLRGADHFTLLPLDAP